MSNFKVILEQLSERKLEEAVDKDGLSGVMIGKNSIKFADRAVSDKVRKVISEYKKQNPSAGDKALLRLAGAASKMKTASVKEIINFYTLSTTDAYKDILN